MRVHFQLPCAEDARFYSQIAKSLWQSVNDAGENRRVCFNEAYRFGLQLIPGQRQFFWRDEKTAFYQLADICPALAGLT